MAVGSPGLLQGAGTSRARSCKGYRSTCTGALMLKTPEVDGDNQLVPLVCQVELLCLKVGINVSKLSSSRISVCITSPKSSWWTALRPRTNSSERPSPSSAPGAIGGTRSGSPAFEWGLVDVVLHPKDEDGPRGARSLAVISGGVVGTPTPRPPGQVAEGGKRLKFEAL